MAFTGSWGQWYEESEHPRGQGGKWTSKGGGTQSGGADRFANVKPSIGKYKRINTTKQFQALCRASVPSTAKEDTLYSDEYETVVDYAMGESDILDAFALNDSLRRNKGKVGRNWKRTVANMDKAIATGRLSQNLALHRGLSGDVIASRLQKLNPGDAIIDHGYVSTSVWPDVGEGYAEQGLQLMGSTGGISLIILADKDSKVLPIAESEYGEVLLPRSSRLVFVRKGRDGLYFRLDQTSKKGKMLALESDEEDEEIEIEGPEDEQEASGGRGAQQFSNVRSARPALTEEDKTDNPIVGKWHEWGPQAEWVWEVPISAELSPPIWTIKGSSEKVHKLAVEAVHALGLEKPVEHGISVIRGSKGSTKVMAHAGGPNHVYLHGSSMNTLIKEGESWDFVHNHPSPYTLSGGDLSWLNYVKSAGSITAVDKTGGVFTASFPARVTGGPGQWTRETFDTLVEYVNDRMTLNDLGENVIPEARQMKARNDAGDGLDDGYRRQLHFLKNHARNVALQNAGYIRYDFTLSDQQQGWLDSNRDIFDTYQRWGNIRVAEAEKMFDKVEWIPERKKEKAA